MGEGFLEIGIQVYWVEKGRGEEDLIHAMKKLEHNADSGRPQIYQLKNCVSEERPSDRIQLSDSRFISENRIVNTTSSVGYVLMDMECLKTHWKKQCTSLKSGNGPFAVTIGTCGLDGGELLPENY